MIIAACETIFLYYSELKMHEICKFTTQVDLVRRGVAGCGGGGAMYIFVNNRRHIRTRCLRLRAPKLVDIFFPFHRLDMRVTRDAPRQQPVNLTLSNGRSSSL